LEGQWALTCGSPFFTCLVDSSIPLQYVMHFLIHTLAVTHNYNNPFILFPFYNFINCLQKVIKCHTHFAIWEMI
jgi:hypothetical protein